MALPNMPRIINSVYQQKLKYGKAKRFPTIPIYFQTFPFRDTACSKVPDNFQKFGAGWLRVDGGRRQSIERLGNTMRTFLLIKKAQTTLTFSPV